MAASRDELEALYRERYLGFRRALAAFTGSYEVAHDVVQEAFARALAQRHTYRGEAPVGAWVWGIAVRVARDEQRYSKQAAAGEIVAGDAIESGLAEPAHDPELKEAYGL